MGTWTLWVGSRGTQDHQLAPAHGKGGALVHDRDDFVLIQPRGSNDTTTMELDLEKAHSDHDFGAPTSILVVYIDPFGNTGRLRSIIGLLLGAFYIHIMNITELLLSGGIQGFWVQG